MDTDINIDEILEKRDELLDILLQRINNWDNSVEAGMDIIENNKLEIDKLKLINEDLKERDLSHRDEEYMDKIALILSGQKEIILKLSKRQDEVKTIMRQLSKKDKIRENYIEQNQNSIFVDRDY